MWTLFNQQNGILPDTVVYTFRASLVYTVSSRSASQGYIESICLMCSGYNILKTVIWHSEGNRALLLLTLSVEMPGDCYHALHGSGNKPRATCTRQVHNASWVILPVIILGSCCFLFLFGVFSFRLSLCCLVFYLLLKPLLNQLPYNKLDVVHLSDSKALFWILDALDYKGNSCVIEWISKVLSILLFLF